MFLFSTKKVGKEEEGNGRGDTSGLMTFGLALQKGIEKRRPILSGIFLPPRMKSRHNLPLLAERDKNQGFLLRILFRRSQNQAISLKGGGEEEAEGLLYSFVRTNRVGGFPKI